MRVAAVLQSRVPPLSATRSATACATVVSSVTFGSPPQTCHQAPLSRFLARLLNDAVLSSVVLREIKCQLMSDGRTHPDRSGG